MPKLTIFAIEHIPMIQPGDDLGSILTRALHTDGEALQRGDIVVVAQKIISKAEDRLVDLDDVAPGPQALELAEVTGKDPAHIQTILDDSRTVIRARRGLLITEQLGGWICANAGVDQSNVAGARMVALLPVDADASAERLRNGLRAESGIDVGVIICDSHGRPWRSGTVGISIGCAGLPPLWDQRGLRDLEGYELIGSEECIVDELAAAASLVMGQSDEGRPAAIVRGYALPPDLPVRPARFLQRDPEMDLFR